MTCLRSLHIRICLISLYLYRYIPVSCPTWANTYCSPSANWNASTLPSLKQTNQLHSYWFDISGQCKLHLFKHTSISSMLPFHHCLRPVWFTFILILEQDCSFLRQIKHWNGSELYLYCTWLSTTSLVRRRISRHRWNAFPNRDFLRSLVVRVLTGFRLKL